MTDPSVKAWNDKELRKRGVNTFSQPSYKIVRSIGDAKRATLWDGTVVHRTDAIFVGGYGLVKCAPYELHFIYETPEHMKGWGLYCTCGSIAGVVGYNAYSKLAAPTDTGMIIACVRHTSLKDNIGIGQHADGSTE